MSEESTANAANSISPAAKAQAVPGQRNGQSESYGSRRQAEAAGRPRPQSAGAPVEVAKRLAEVGYGGTYLTKDGQTLPCTLNSLVDFQITGFTVVMVAMAGLYLASSAASRLVRTLCRSADLPCEPVAVSPDGSPSARPAETHGMHPGLTDQQLIVILTAAASEALGGPVQIGRIRQVNVVDSNWTAQGRSVLHSHRLNK